MISSEIFLNPALPRAVVMGLFGGLGLAFTVTYARRAPMIIPAYAALLAALAILVSRYSYVSYAGRFAAVLAGFLLASAGAYTAAVRGAADQRSNRREKSCRTADISQCVGLIEHARRIGFVVGVGIVVSAGIVFVAT